MKPESKTLILKDTFLLEKWPGKGGWTYALLPIEKNAIKSAFGWIKVNGSIDNFAFTDHKLMSLASGKLFFPVKAEIRKKIGKEAGDYVVISIYGEAEVQETEDDILQCFMDEPKAYQSFLKKTDEEKQAILAAIRSAKNIDIKTDLIIKSINTLLKEM